MAPTFVRAIWALLLATVVVLLATPYASDYFEISAPTFFVREWTNYTVRFAGIAYYPFRPEDSANIQIDYQSFRQYGERRSTRVAWEFVALEWLVAACVTFAFAPFGGKSRNKIADSGRPTVIDKQGRTACHECSVLLADFHYSLESIELARTVGCQCDSCGRLLCNEHSEKYSSVPSSKLKCANCGGRIVWLMAGAAYSSMVSKASRMGQYGEYIRPPEEQGREMVNE